MTGKQSLTAAAVLIALVCFVALTATAFKSLINVQAWEQQCTELVTEDGGFSGQAVISADDGLNSVTCSNLSSNIVYFGGSTVAAAQGFPVCTSASCAGKTFAIDTNNGQVWCTTAADLDGGYQAVRCIAGR
jgi:hypothetical protein